MPRQASIIRHLSRPFNDHWGLWIPSLTDENIGTVIDVEGDPRDGFRHEIKRNYNKKLNPQRSILFTFLGNIDDVHLDVDNVIPISSESAGEEGFTVDTNPRNGLERYALSIPPPLPSMNSVAIDATNATDAAVIPRRRELKDCQWWLAQVVAKLVEEGVLSSEAIDTMKQTPQN
ncbi:hypothetical protein FQN57_000213 [Myotisia sp. PD_48]|nr:hypothetical protein FQN57_000213 [Myotisia sp. PD_48]